MRDNGSKTSSGYPQVTLLVYPWQTRPMSTRRLTWQILLKVLPLTALFCLVKVAFHQLGWEPWAFDTLTASLFGSATFVIALVLNGTLSDYRTSDAIPTEMANALETIYDTALAIAATQPDYNPTPLRQQLIDIAQSIQAWLMQGAALETVETAVTQLNPLLAPIAQFGGPVNMSRIQTQQAKIRLLLAQIQGNRDTDFLAPAYALLWIFLMGAISALLLINAELFSENLTVSTFLFTSFVYLVILIRDLDNPFQYDGRSSVDVSLAPLQAVCDRLSTR